MKNWYVKNLGDAMLAYAQQEHIAQNFLSAYTDAGNPEAMAVFVRHESEGRLHCEVKIYFSPLAATIANAVDAEPCNKPSAIGLSLLAGSEDSWQMLFPESAQ